MTSMVEKGEIGKVLDRKTSKMFSIVNNLPLLYSNRIET